MASCTRRTVSSIPSGSSDSREEWDVESCATSFQELVMSPNTHPDEPHRQDRVGY